jgi:flagellar basal-body rod protein FlgF/flagellar basal-body rod protein FlgG
MDSGFYAACTALMARTSALDAIANDLANTNTTGFRGQEDTFGSVMAAAGAQPNNLLNQATNNYGILGQTTLNLTQGPLTRTGNPLDVAIEGSGFFTVQTANGPMYTRDGAFKVSASGQLVTASGDAVLGTQGVIQLPQGPVSISPDGTISSNGALVSKLAVVEFPPGTAIESAGNTYYSAPAGTARPAVDSQLQQGSIEDSNVNPITSVVALINAQRSAEQMRHALTMFDSQMNKTAVQDLPKVS